MNLESQTNQRSALLIYVLLAVATLAVYLQVIEFGYISLDDRNYIINNDHVATGLTFENIRWAFSSYHASNWHPLTWISHMIDVEMFGVGKPGGYHFVKKLFNLSFDCFAGTQQRCLFSRKSKPAHIGLG